MVITMKGADVILDSYRSQDLTQVFALTDGGIRVLAGSGLYLAANDERCSQLTTSALTNPRTAWTFRSGQYKFQYLLSPASCPNKFLGRSGDSLELREMMPGGFESNAFFIIPVARVA